MSSSLRCTQLLRRSLSYAGRILPAFLIALPPGCDKPKASKSADRDQKHASATANESGTPGAKSSPSQPVATAKSKQALKPPPKSPSASKTSNGKSEPQRDQRIIEFEPLPMNFGVDTNEKASQEALARGRRAAQNKDWKKAADEFLTAVAFDPINVTARGELGFAEQQLSYPTEHLLRSAETLAETVESPNPLRAAIIHNLAKGYEMAKKPILAQRAKTRAQALKAGGAEDAPGCAVVVRVTKTPDLWIQSWLEAYAHVVEDQITQWGEPPTTNEAARRALCEQAERSQPSMPATTKCAVGQGWTLATTHGPRRTIHYLWPIADGRVVVTSSSQIGIMGQACDGAPYSEAMGLDNFVLSKNVDSLTWPYDEWSGYERREFESFDRVCSKLAITHTVNLYDVTLEREFEIEGLGSNVSLELHPKQHAVTIHGQFCEEWVSLKDCKTGVCASTPID